MKTSKSTLKVARMAFEAAKQALPQYSHPKSPNERKAIFNKGLRKFMPPRTPQKQSQNKANSNPIQSQS
jgi:hypothetical protein